MRLVPTAAWALIAIVVVGLLYYTPNQRASAADTDAVLQADATRLAAMMAGDGAGLARVLSDEIVFVHSDGRMESKAEYVKNVMAGDTAYADAKTSEVRTLQPAPNVIILLGAQDMRKKLGPTWSQIHLRFMSVWRNENGAWRMFAWQSMRPSGNSVVPPKEGAAGGTQSAPKKA